MHEQRQHLAEQGRRQHIGIQIVSASRAANAGNIGAFTFASLDNADVMLMNAIEDVTTCSGHRRGASRPNSLYSPPRGP
jgi:hypothetical protein